MLVPNEDSAYHIKGVVNREAEGAQGPPPPPDF